jgi:hypothetical protein
MGGLVRLVSGFCDARPRLHRKGDAVEPDRVHSIEKRGQSEPRFYAGTVWQRLQSAGSSARRITSDDSKYNDPLKG